MKSRDFPEEMENPPEFVRIVFDKDGHAIDIKPEKNPKVDDANNSSGQIYTSHIRPIQLIRSVTGQLKHTTDDGTKKLLLFQNANIESLREQVRQLNYALQQMAQIVNNGKGNIDMSFTDSIQPLMDEMKNIGKRMELQDQAIHALGNRLNAGMNELFMQTDEVKNIRTLGGKLDIINLYVDELSKKIDQAKSPALEEKLGNLDLTVSGLVKGLDGIKINEMSAMQHLKTILEEILILNQELQTGKIKEDTFKEKMDSMKKQLSGINEKVLQNNIENQNIAVRIEDKINEFNGMDEKFYGVNGKLDAFKSETENSIQQLKEGQNHTSDLLIRQEQVYKNVVKDALLEIKSMMKKPKRAVKKPQRARVVRFLKKNFRIKPFSNVLVVSDRRNHVFGKTLHDAVRGISKKSVLAVVENKTVKQTFDRPVVEAMKRSSMVFLVGKYNIKKIKDAVKVFGHPVKIVSIRRTLKYSVL